jgi:two-component system LytT family response regulator
MTETNSIRALVVDDEEKGRKNLITLLGRFCPQVQVAGEAESVETALALLDEIDPDLVFLDIQMPSGNGFSLYKYIESRTFEVIFVTGHSQYAINAIRHEALDYLLKPVDVNELTDAVAKAQRRIRERQEKDLQTQPAIGQLSPPTEPKISVHEGDKVLLIKASSISSIEADDRYCHLVTASKARHTLSKTLKDMEDLLAGNPRFVRINRKFIINVDFISDYGKGYPCVIELVDGRQFEVSRRKKQEVLEALKGDSAKGI